jgi:ABC-type uncharacterized transport system substrate-binding protein
MMSRRRFIAGVVLAVTPLDTPASAQEYKAQPTGRVPHLAYVVPAPRACGMTPGGEAFQQALSEFGYVRGRTIRWDRHCFQREEGISELITGLVRQKPDVILVTGTPSALAAKAATSSIPIVFAGAGDLCCLARRPCFSACGLCSSRVPYGCGFHSRVMW